MPDVKISALPAATSVSDVDVLVLNQGSPATTKKVTYGTLLPAVGTNTGTFGSDSAVGQVTVDVKGRVTAAASVPINATNISTGTLPVARGGTGATTHTLGAYLRGNGTGAITSQVGIPTTDITSGTLPVARGGTGAATLAASGYLKGNGTSAITSQTGVPIADIVGTIGFDKGGTGQTTRQAAMDALAGAVTNAQYLRGNGTDVVMSALQAADLTGVAPATAQPALTGDVTCTAGSTATTLAASGVTAGTYGSSSQVGTFTVDAKGRLTAASSTAISPVAIGAVRKSQGLTAVNIVLTPSTFQIVTVSVANASYGVPVVAALDASTSPTPGLGLIISAYCSSPGTVTVMLANFTSSNIGFFGNIVATVFY